MAVRLRRTRLTCLTLALLLGVIFIVFNIFSMDMNTNMSSIGVKYFQGSAHKIMVNRNSEKSKPLSEFQVNFAAQGQRKPKTMNLRNAVEDEIDETAHKFHLNKLKSIKEQGSNEDFKYNGAVNNPNAYDDQAMEEMQDLDNDYDDEDEDEDDDDYDYDDEYNPNPVFKPGDFGDIRGLEFYQKPKLKYETVKPKVKASEKAGINTQDGKVEAVAAMEMEKRVPEVIQNGIFWSPIIETSIPKGLSYRNLTQLIHSLHSQTVQTLDDPTWDRCGRPKNGFITLGDGTQMCVRYRHPHTNFVYGEALSFYLSRLLGLDSVPVVILATTSSTSRKWRAVNISALEWQENETVAFIQWIDNLNSGHRSRAYIPDLITEAYHSGIPVTKERVYRAFRAGNTSIPALAELAQWGSMIILDYLTGNYDRVASMQDAADKDGDPHILQEPIRNLRKSSQTRKLWLIDNESGLLDAYELLAERKHGARFFKFHDRMLKTMCIYQSSVVNALNKLVAQTEPHVRLLNFASSLEPLMKNLPKDRAYDLFQSKFETRLRDVVSWIETCKQRHAR